MFDKDTKFAIKMTLLIFGIALTVVLFIAWVGGLFSAREVQPPPVEAVATAASSEIVTGICTFGDCPVATTEETTTEPVIESRITVVQISQTTEKKTLPSTEVAEQVSEEETDAEPERDVDPSEEEEPATDDEEYAAVYSASYFRRMGVIRWGGWRWTWYSERVLPGSGLRIPGRHADGNGFIRDCDGYICCASDVLGYGTVIETPFGGYGKIYDCGCDADVVDVYVSW